MGSVESRRSAVSLAMLMLVMSMSPLLIQAEEIPWIGPSTFLLEEATVDGFEIESNGTVTDAWVLLDSDGSDLFSAPGWETGKVGRNFSNGLIDNTSTTLFPGELSLDNAANHGRIHDFEELEYRFNQWVPGGTTSVWEVMDPSSLSGNVVTINTSFGQTQTARQNGGGFAPRHATDGSLIALTQSDQSLDSGVHSWIESPIHSLPNYISNLTFTLDHWLHIWTDSDSSGSGAGAWIEASFDGGNTWNWVEPEGGYGNTISSSAPVPNGANGTGFPAWASMNATGWQRSQIIFDNHPMLVNASSLSVRLVIWTPITQSVDRPGWFVDRVGFENDGHPPGAWFHGNLNGEYAAGAESQLVLDANLSGISGPLVFQYAADFDMEGDIYDNWHVDISDDGVNWTSITPTLGLPGHGVYINGTTIIDDSNGWVSLQHSIPTGFNTSIQIRFRFESDFTGGTGFGGLTVDPPEGLALDDVRIVEVISGNETEIIRWNFNDSTTANHSRIGNSLVDQWQFLPNVGVNGPWSDFDSFEDSILTPIGWNIETPNGYGWSFGELNSTGPDPNNFPGGGNGAGILLNSVYRQNSLSHLYSPSIPIPLGSRATLQFDHFICAESGWDGGALYVSTDQGHTWSHFGSHIPDWYDSMQYNNSLSPLYGKMAWDGSRQKGGGCGTNTSFVQKSADFSHFAGRNIMLRFTFFSDTYFESSGWYIDNVGIAVDVFEEIGNWTSPLIFADSLGWGSIDIDAKVPEGTHVLASVLDSQGSPISGFINQSFPVHLADLNGLSSINSDQGIHLRLQLSTNHEHRTPRINEISINGSRFLSGFAVNSTGWELDPSLVIQQTEGVISNPTFMTKRVEGSSIISERRVEEIQLESISAGVMIQVIADGQQVHSGMINNGTISFFRPATILSFILDFQPGSELEYLAIRPILSTPSIGPSIDVLNDGILDWKWPDSPSGNPLTYGLLQGPVLESNSNHLNGSMNFSLPDEADWRSASLLIRPNSGTDVTYSIRSGSSVHYRTLSSGDVSLVRFDGSILRASQSSTLSSISMGPNHNMEMRDLEIIVNSSDIVSASISLISVDYHLETNLSNLGPMIESYRLNYLNSNSVSSINSLLRIPVHLEQEQGGGLIFDGKVIQSPLISDEIVSHPTTFVPEIISEIVSEHEHLFDSSLIHNVTLDFVIEGIESVSSFHLDISNGQPVIINESGGPFTLVNPRIAIHEKSVQITWPISVDWSIDDVDEVRIYATAIDHLNQSWGPAEAVVGSGGLLGIENDMEIVGFSVFDGLGRDLLDSRLYGYPLHLHPEQTISVSGSVRFEGIVGPIPPNSAAVGIEISNENQSWSYLAEDVDADGTWSASISLPNIENSTPSSIWEINPRLIRVGPVDVVRSGALDSTVVTTPGSYRVDLESPIVGRLLADISGIQRPLDEDIWSLSRPLIMSLEIFETESLSRELILMTWIESKDDLNLDGVAQPSEYSSKLVILPSNAHQTEIVNLGLLDISQGTDGSLVSVFVTGTDASGRAYLGGGSGGIHADLATFSLAQESPTQIDRNTISLDSVDGTILHSVSHTMSFLIEDLNGYTSIDEIHLWISGIGDETGHLIHRPLLGNLESAEGSKIIPISAEFIPSDASGNSGLATFTFATGEDSPFDWTLSSQVPAITVVEDEATLDLDLLSLADIAWTLDTSTSWNVLEIEDLTAPFGRFYDGRMYAADGDAILCRLQMVHSVNGQPLSVPPVGRNVVIDPHFEDVMETTPGVPVNGTVDTEGIVEFVIVLPQTERDTEGILRGRLIGTGTIPWSGFDVDVVVDRTAPTVEFLQTSLAAVQTNRLDSQQVSFSILDLGGVAEEEVEMFWTFRRFGVDIPGTDGSSWIGPASMQGLVYGVSNNVDISTVESNELQDGDQLVVWFEFTDLSGNPIEGIGSELNPRAPLLRVVWFEPVVEPIAISPQPANLNGLVRIDLWIRDEGNQGGNLNLSLLGWETDSSGQKWVEINRTEIQLLPGGSIEVDFEIEAWQEGQMLLIAAIDGDIENATVLPPIQVVDPMADRSLLDAALSGDLTVIGLLIVIFSGLGFMIGLFVLQRNTEAVYWDDEDDIPLPEEEPPSRPKSLWPEPPERFPDEEE